MLLALLTDIFYLIALSPFLAIYAYISFPKTLGARLTNAVKKQLEESGAERFINIPRSLKLEEDGLLSSSDAGLAKYPYSSVIEIAMSDRHIFVVIKGGTGYTIPVTQVKHQYDDFLAELHQRVASANSSSHTGALAR